MAEEEKIVWVDKEDANEFFGVENGKTIQEFDQPVWDNLAKQWRFDMIVRDD